MADQSISKPRIPAKRPFLRISAVGVVYVFMMCIICFAAINSQANLLYGVFGLMLGVLLVCFTMSRIVLGRLAVERDLPEHGVVGKPMAVMYTYTNRKRYWPSLSIFLRELQGAGAFGQTINNYVMHVAAGTSATSPAEIVPTRRGIYRLGAFQLNTAFPFGFIQRTFNFRQEGSLVIYPALASLDPRIFQGILFAEHAGMATRPRPGGSDEFFGVREFRHGDNPRWINWRRSARGGVMVSNEMTRLAPPRLLLMVDTLAQTPATPGLVEKTIAMAATLASHGIESGFSVGLCAWRGKWEIIRPSRGKRHLKDMLSLLAALTPNTSGDVESLIESSAGELRQGATGVLLTPLVARQTLQSAARVSFAADQPRCMELFRFDEGIDFANCAPLADGEGA